MRNNSESECKCQINLICGGKRPQFVTDITERPPLNLFIIGNLFLVAEFHTHIKIYIDRV